MRNSGRRLSPRRKLDRPLEAELLLCQGHVVAGWIVDEQDDGLGMAFGDGDVPRLEEHRACCLGGPVDLWLNDGGARGRPVPVRLAHVTKKGEARDCRAGLAFDVSRMTAEDVAHLLAVWRHLMATPV